jgi:hypothetical protein
VDAPAGNRRPGWGRRCGLGAADLSPPTPADGRSREASVWSGFPRAVPRTHGSRAAPGPRSSDTTIGLRGARWTGTAPMLVPGNAALEPVAGARKRPHANAAMERRGASVLSPGTPRLRRPGSPAAAAQAIVAKASRPWRDWKRQRHSALHSPHFFAGDFEAQPARRSLRRAGGALG